ncbi:hypothetical protein HDV05_007488 [Chytridiales sp. JEL 0842]|nr:hypothetical protein HDV05_007488 [Chytridiales sp. JEL 0842]
MFGIGAGPFWLMGFNMLDRIAGPSNTLAKAAQKAVLSQILLSPAYHVGFLAYGSYFRGSDPIVDIKERFPGLFANACMVWPLINICTFRFVPEGLPRVVFNNGTGILWSAYLSTVGAAAGSAAAAAAAAKSNPPATIETMKA